jgi:hypothetical protein
MKQLLVTKQIPRDLGGVQIENATLIIADAYEFIASLPDKYIEGVVTSPPFMVQDLGGVKNRRYLGLPNDEFLK